MNGKTIGSFGNTTCFSFQARKIITTGEGGMVITSDAAIEAKLKALRSQGAFPQKTSGNEFNLPLFQLLGLSYRLSDIQAAVGIVQMRRIDDFLERRKKLAKYYNDLFDDMNINVQTPLMTKDVHQNFQTYVVIIKDGNRDQIITKLKSKNIESTIGTYSLSLQPLFKGKEKYCVSEYVYKNSLALPMYHELTEEDIYYIVKSIKI